MSDDELASIQREIDEYLDANRVEWGRIVK